jgi:flagellar biosynthetic protein FliR
LFPNFQFNETEILAFALVLIRMSAFLVSWPVFSAFNVPQVAKILFAVTITMVIFPTVNRTGLTQHALDNEIIWLVLREVFIGLCLGFITRIFFFAVSIGGNFISVSMGLSSAQMFNPALSQESSTVETFFIALTTLLFLSLNGHHFFISGLVDSFTAVPLGVNGVNLAVFKESAHWMQIVMVAGVKISAPVMASVFFMNVVMGIIGRAVPQINVFVTSLPVNIMVGFTVMFLMLPLLFVEMDDLLQVMSVELFKLIKAF